MEKILDSIQKSLDNQNWYSALVLSLIVPDICSKLEGDDKSSSKRYPDWFNKYLGEKYFNFLSGDDCYSLRCSFLHEGIGNIENQSRKDVLDHIVFTPNGGHCSKISNCNFGNSKYNNKEILKLSTFQFCQDIISAAKEWLTDVKNDNVIQENIQELITIDEAGFSIGNAILMK